MSKSSLVLKSVCLAAMLCVPNCRPEDTALGAGGGGGAASTGGATSPGGSTSEGGATSTGGSPGTGGVASGGNTTPSGGTKAVGGATSAGGSGPKGGAISSGGATSRGGNTSTGGTNSPGGTTSTGGVIGAGGATAKGGTTSSGGTTAAGGTVGTGGTMAPRTDCLGKALAKPGDSSGTSRAYLNLGDLRIINNRWGADELGCSAATYKIYVNSDKTIGYDFNRPTCGGAKAKPDYPEVEFGVAPFGANSPDLTSPACSSTSLLPIQLKNLTSATLNIENFSSTYQKPGYFDTNFEFWISKSNPLTGTETQYAEVIAFLGWDGIRMTTGTGWPCDKSGTVNAGGATFVLCHQSDSWGSPKSGVKWRFFNYNLSNGPQNNFSGKIDIKAMLKGVRDAYSGFTDDMWLTRIEVGTEVDDNTQGSATIKNLTFEINGTSKSIELGQ